jgi:RNA polymerase sigma-70 factor, ECF subfamily
VATVIAASSPDRQLVDAVLAGHTEAFRLLLERESPQVIAICRRILSDADEAEDVAQEAFLQAYRRLATFRGDGAFGAWVTRIALRQAFARLATRRGDEPLDPESELELAERQPSDDPELAALNKEHRVAIREAVAALPPAQREVVALRFFGSLSLEEIARSTGQPLGTVKSRLHRAMASLREGLAVRSAR